MKYYRIVESTNIEVVGKFPQRGKMYSELPINNKKHLFTHPVFTRLSADIYIPRFKLRNEAKMTDMLSPAIENDFIISNTLKSILQEEAGQDYQFIPIEIYDGSKKMEYYLLRPVELQPDYIDFEKTEILIIDKKTGEEKKNIKVKDKDQLTVLIKETKFPNIIQIPRPVILDSCTSNLFSLRNIYNGYACFISAQLKSKLENEKISGVQFMEL